ncbi:helix-turn-helix domain-containing protein [Alcaligenaceae bacterium CGII-47]|nr:helix-turn-helix domain-containing protein [Alcaligenaceae bacterium CGII-47]
MTQLLTKATSDDPSADELAYGPGAALKAMREARGLSLSEVSSRIKYSAVQLGFLESEQWSRLPEGVPLRGLVRNYARFLDTDVDAVLRLLDNEVGPTHAYASVSSNQRALPQTGLAAGGEPVRRTWIWLLLILILLGVAGLYAINRGWVPEDWLIFDWLKAIKP